MTLGHRFCSTCGDPSDRCALSKKAASYVKAQRKLIGRLNLSYSCIAEIVQKLKELHEAVRDVNRGSSNQTIPLGVLGAVPDTFLLPSWGSISEAEGAKELYSHPTAIQGEQCTSGIAQSINTYPNFGVEELKTLIALIEAEEIKIAHAREKLIMRWLYLVVAIAKRYMNRGVGLLDLIQEGNLGLLKAARKYHPLMGCRFSSYATWWIRQAITRAIANHARMVKIPIHRGEVHATMQKAFHYLSQKLSRKASIDEIAHFLEYPSDEVQKTLDMVVDDLLSLETPVSGEEDTVLGEFIGDSTIPSPEDAAVFSDLQHLLESALSRLPHREQTVLRLRYGMGGGRDYTLEEVGHNFHLTKERIRQIEGDALRKIKKSRGGKDLKTFID